MNKALAQAIRYIKWRFKAKSIYGIHSTFVYDLAERLRKKGASDRIKRYDHYVRKLKKSKTVIETVDFGAGADNGDYKTIMTEVGKLVKKRTHGFRQLHMLFRISEHLKPRTILEFGTAAGVSAIYLKKPVPNAKMVTMEGCASLANRAERTFKELHMHNVDIEIGNFDIILPEVLKKFETIDLIYFDGNHRYEPTINYFKQCLPYTNEESVFIFDDIYWSDEMSKAWETIKNDPRVTLTVDLYWFGLVFFKKNRQKQHIRLKI